MEGWGESYVVIPLELSFPKSLDKMGGIVGRTKKKKKQGKGQNGPYLEISWPSKLRFFYFW